MLFKKNLFTFTFKIIFISFFTVGQIFAQATSTASTTNRYSATTVLTKANELCARYTNYNSIYDTPTVGGGSSVPVDLSQLRDVLLNISRNTQLSANEFRQFNLLKFCNEYQNMAEAAIRIGVESQKTLKNIADNCTADQQCFLDRIYKARLEKEIMSAQKYPLYGAEIAKLIKDSASPEPNRILSYNKKLVDFCNKQWSLGSNPSECWNAPDKGEIIRESVAVAKQNIAAEQAKYSAEFARGNGVIGNRTCTKTASGNDPAEVRFYDEDCISWRTDPGTVNQEVLRQIIALPYNQANSPSSVLGADGVTNNIGTRVREGNLIDPNIGVNFGTTNGGGGVAGTSNLKGAEENYKKILSNVGVIVNLYDATVTIFNTASTTCGRLPVATRNKTISSATSAKKVYTDYKDGLSKLWEAAVKTPNENHIDLITKINLDLKDKINQTLIDKTYDNIKAIVAACG